MKVGDKSLMVTGLFTFLITLGCISVILMKIGGVDGITGFAPTNSSSGFVNVTVTGAVSLTLVNNSVNFGTGVLKVSTDTAGGTRLNASTGTNEGSGFNEPSPFQLRNDGNVYINVTLNGSTPDELFGVSDNGLNYSFALENLTSSEVFTNACGNNSDGSGQGNQAIARANASRIFGTTMSNNHQMVCPNMSYAANGDTLNVTIFLNITEAVGNGTYGDTVEFFVTSLGHS